MKKYLALLGAIMILGGSGCIVIGDFPQRKGHGYPHPRHVAAREVLRHVVMFSFKEGVSPQTIREVEQAFERLHQRIPRIDSFEWGTQCNDRDLDKGLTHCGLFTFDSESDLQQYLDHPVHQDFVELAMPFLDDLLVFDYWTD